MTADQNLDSAPAAPRKLWKTSLFLAGSVVLSGVALVLWNRGDLSRLRHHAETASPAPQPPELEEEIF
ncbi:MAG TPA: hypothetical protein VFL96_08190 [Acidobacteriaceae bacterium]|nr:hypothetical protein [Acidobacteriaceae bacterium]